MNTITKLLEGTTAGQLFGLRFAEDNTVVPVLKHKQFDRIEEGYFRITPSTETTLGAIPIGVRAGRYEFTEVMTRDNIAFGLSLVVRFTFDPRRAERRLQSRIVRLTEASLIGVVRDKTEQILRRRVSDFEAVELCAHHTQQRLEDSILRYLDGEVDNLGIHIVPNGVILSRPQAPKHFKQTMLQARRHQQIIKVLSACKSSAVAEQAILAEFINSLERKDGNLTLQSPLEQLTHYRQALTKAPTKTTSTQ